MDRNAFFSAFIRISEASKIESHSRRTEAGVKKNMRNKNNIDPFFRFFLCVVSHVSVKRKAGE